VLNSVDRLVEECLPNVKFYASSLARKYRDLGVDEDDLVQDGVVGLLKARKRFDKTKGTKVSTFADQSIRGEMIDGLRARFWPKTARGIKTRLSKAVEELSNELGRSPTDEEIASHVGLSVVGVRKAIKRLRIYDAIHSDDGASRDISNLPAMCGTPPDTPHDLLVRKERTAGLIKAMATLLPVERTVLNLYYGQGQTLRQIAKSIRKRQDTASDIHRDAIRKLRAELGGLPEDKTDKE